MAIQYLDDEEKVPPVQAAPAAKPKIEYLDEPSAGIGSKLASVGMGALETLGAPFQVAGEAVRGASESEPLKIATAKDPSGFRAPSIVQRLAPSLKTEKPPADIFQKSYQGLEGIANLPRGHKAASDVITGEPDLAAQVGGMGLALGVMAPRAPKMAPYAQERAGASALPKGAVAEEAAIPKGAPEPPPIGGVPPPPKPPPAAPPPIDPIQEVQNYIGGKYTKFAEKPGMVPKIADYIQEKSQKMALQQLGASPMQAKNLAKTPMEADAIQRAIGQYAMDNDIVGPTISHNQMLRRHAQLMDEAGKTIGSVRKAGDVQAPAANADIVQQVRALLDQEYLSGGTSGTGKKAYELAIKDLENADPTFQGVADVATKLNKNANKAAKINQPHSPYTDVANKASQISNDRLRQVVGPEEAAKYDTGLKHFGINKVIEQFLRRKVGGEVKRIGAGSFTSNMIQKGMDEIGYRAGAKAANKTASWVLKNPKDATNLPSLFKEFIHQVDLPDEPPPGMAHGGIVGEVGAHLESKYGAR